MGGGEHWPDEQIRPAGQLLLQVPQWSGSVLRLKQPSAQAVWPEEQDIMQVPETQDCPDGQALPQEPQFLLSVLISAQVLLQSRRSAGQIRTFVVTAVVGLVVRVSVMLTVGRTVVATVVTGSSVWMMTYDPGAEDWLDAPVAALPWPFIRIKPAAAPIRTRTSTATTTRMFRERVPPDGMEEGLSSGPSGEPHWPQNFSPGLAGAPQEEQDLKRESPEMLSRMFPG